MKYLKVPQNFWQNVLCIDESKVTIFGKTCSAFLLNHKLWWRDHRCVWFLCYFRVWVTWKNFRVYQDILQENGRSYVCQMTLNRILFTLVTTQSLGVNQQKKKMCLLERPNQSPDLSSIEVLWHDLKKMIYIKHSTNTVELKQCCEE